MKKLIFVFLFILLAGGLHAQRQLGRSGSPRETFDAQDSTLTRRQKVTKSDKPVTKIEDYLIISYQNDTTYVDTTLTIKKDYKFNYLRKDNFGLQPFSNMGQTYNTLTNNFESTRLMPQFGARARHFNYMEIEDINYYRVPTPLTELMYKTAFEQGQLADSFFTVNTSPQFNFSIAYKGLRSIGKYQHLLTSTGNFRFTTNYQSRNKRYYMWMHIVTQDLLNQENGGLNEESVQNFISGAPEFLDRSILEVKFENAESILKGKRLFLKHEYNIIRKKDSLSKNKLSVGHMMSFEDKNFQFDQARAETSYFGSTFKSSGLRDRADLRNFYNQFQVNYSNDLLGDVQFNASANSFNYGYDRVVVLADGSRITNRLKGNVYAAGGSYHKKYKGFELEGQVGINLVGDFDGNFLKAQASFQLNKDFKAIASLNHSSKAPNYNTLLYQSDYTKYNWQNSFNNTETDQLAFELKSSRIANISVDYTTINDYTYFKEDQATNQVRPFQSDKTINYLRVKLQKEIKFGKFALDNTVMYQTAQDTDTIFNVPEIITRNTLYFSTNMFQKALYLQTGITLNYFTTYYMDAYNPVLAEFYVQNDDKFGGFPRLDFFINAKIRQTRIFVKAEHFNAGFTGYDYFSAPGNPYRDFIVRFGVVWNFFL
ncbi:putative porin [Gaetbulibacter sp. M240]|uniref:putative porin n=1 Tax=Gaetbulibacter sp. M240 TaxID=3126511 RepID=UPI00374FBAFF